MRLLLIEEDARRCAHVRQRLAAWRPHAQLVVHSPLTQGALAQEFLAQGFDAVLLADTWPGGRGLKTWGSAGRQPGQFAYPWGVAVDKQDRVVAVDAGNNRLQVFEF